MLASGRTTWSVGERIRVYRTRAGGGDVVLDPVSDADPRAPDRRDYDVEHYLRVLRETFAARLARAFTPGDFAAVFADPDQPSLFEPVLSEVRTILRAHRVPAASVEGSPSDGRPGAMARDAS